jgi:Tol biopolymer transport system component
MVRRTGLRQRSTRWVGALLLGMLLLGGCGPHSWRSDARLQAVRKACQGLDDMARYDCIEIHAVTSLDPDLCRLAGIWIDDMCLQAVYEAAGDPAICEQIYLKGVRPTCRAYYESRERGATGTAPVWHHFLFGYNHDGATELWTIDLGSAKRLANRLIRPLQTVQDAALSPAGDTIAYVRVTGDYGGVVTELWLMDRDGSNPRLLYTPPAGHSVVSRPAWLPSGSDIAFIQRGSQAHSALLRLPAAGGEPAIVLADCLDFASSPDGQWLASVDLDRQLALFRWDGTCLRDLEVRGLGFADYYSLAISPDGESLAFQATEEGIDTWNLYVLEMGVPGVRRLTGLSGFHPFTASSGEVNGLAWSADGAQLVYSVDGHRQQSGIWRIDLDGGEPRRLFAWREGEWAAIQGPWFAPQGTLGP